MNFDALAVMIRALEPGKVKTRLCPSLTSIEAVGLYKALVKDTFLNISTLKNIDKYAACTVPRATGGLSDILPEEISLIIQEGDTLGDRLYNVFKALFAKGYKRVAIIGSDSPDLPRSFIIEAFSLLAKNAGSVVLGPAVDGGYYLIAMDALRPEPFKELPWGTAEVFKRTMEALSTAKINVKLLSEWYDIDTPQDLQRLCPNPNAPSCELFLKEHSIFGRSFYYTRLKKNL